MADVPTLDELRGALLMRMVGSVDPNFPVIEALTKHLGVRRANELVRHHSSRSIEEFCAEVLAELERMYPTIPIRGKQWLS